MTVDHDADVRDLVARVGEALNESGDAVPSITSALQQILEAQGSVSPELLVLPNAVLVRTGSGAETGMQLSSSMSGTFRFDQISALCDLIKRLQTGPADVAAANSEINRISAMPAPFAWPLRVLGHGVLTLGFALLLRASPTALLLCFGLGILIGLLKLSPLGGLALVFPTLMACVVTVIALLADQHLGFSDPLRVLIPPLITFLPGGALTIGMIEITSNHIMSGASRLVAGVIQLLLLSFGILAGAAILRTSIGDLNATPSADLGAWAVLVGLVAYLVGLVFQFSSPVRFLAWMLVVLLMAYAGQLAGAAIFGGQMSAFFGALAMTPLVLIIDRRTNGPSKLITFLPAFWFLVPGAAGLIAIVGSTSVSLSGALGSVAFTVAAIALGVLVGTAAFNSLAAGLRPSGRGGT